jgi:ChpA-C
VRAASLGLRLTAWSGIVVAGLALALTGQGAAQASTVGTTTGNGSVGSGNQLVLPISVPIDLCGNVIAALGLGRAQCTGGAAVASGAPSSTASSTGTGKVEQAAPQNTGSTGTSGTGGVLSGNQISVPITIPVTVCGNAAALLGTATASCQSARSTPPPCHCKPPVRRKPRPIMQSARPPAIHPEVASATGILPITGVNLAGMAAGGVILLTGGAGTLLVARRRC